MERRDRSGEGPLESFSASHRSIESKQATNRPNKESTHSQSTKHTMVSPYRKWVKERETDSQKVLVVDLLNPSAAEEARKHKLKTLVPAPRSFFMDVKCPG